MAPPPSLARQRPFPHAGEMVVVAVAPALEHRMEERGIRRRLVLEAVDQALEAAQRALPATSATLVFLEADDRRPCRPSVPPESLTMTGSASVGRGDAAGTRLRAASPPRARAAARCRSGSASRVGALPVLKSMAQTRPSRPTSRRSACAVSVNVRPAAVVQATLPGASVLTAARARAARRFPGDEETGDLGEAGTPERPRRPG